MVEYLFQPPYPGATAAWTDPDVWVVGTGPAAGPGIPDGSDAEVVLPVEPPGTAVQLSGSTVPIQSLSIDQDALDLDNAGLLVGGASTVCPGGQIELGGNLQFADASALTHSGLLTVAEGGEIHGNGSIDGPIMVNGTIIADAGLIAVANLLVSAGNGGTITGSGTLEVGSNPALSAGTMYYHNTGERLEIGSAASVDVRFADAAGVLVLDDPSQFSGAIIPAPIQFTNTGYLDDTPNDYGPTIADVVHLPGLSLGEITGMSYAGNATGGVLTVATGETAIHLRFIGDLSINSFTLGAGASGPEPGETSVDLSIAPVPAPPLLGLHLDDGGSPAIGITNTSTPVVSGTAPAHNVITLHDETGAFLGTPTLTTANPGNTAGTYDFRLLPLAPGRHEIMATASGTVATVTGIVPFSLLVLPDPVNGMTVASSVDSAAVAALRDQGAGMQFRPDTEALQFTDGTLSVGPDTDAAEIQRLYEGLLGRVGDTNGLSTFQALLNKSGAAAVASAMLESPEFQNRHGAVATLNPTEFVTLLYEGLLGRAPDAAGLTVQLRGLQYGMSDGLIAANIAASSESKAYLAADTANVWVPDASGSVVTELFRTGLDRAPDPGGLSIYAQALQSGVSIETLANSIVASPEFLRDHAGQDTASLIASFYAGGLGRAPDPIGTNHWESQIAGGASLGSVLAGIATSPEAQIHLIRTI